MGSAPAGCGLRARRPGGSGGPRRRCAGPPGRQAARAPAGAGREDTSTVTILIAFTHPRATRSWTGVLRLLAPGPRLRRRGGRSGLPGADALLDPVAESLVHVAPVLEGALEDRLGHAAQQVADDVADQPVLGGVVQDLADHRPGLTQ